MTPYRGFADLLRERRAVLGLTLKQAGDMLGWSGGYFSDLERGIKPPPPDDQLPRLAQTFDLDLDDLRREAALSRRTVEIALEPLPLLQRQAAIAIAQRFAGGVTDQDALALLDWAHHQPEVAS